MRSVFKDSLAALIGWVFVSSAWAADGPDAGIPFRLHREHHIVVQGSIGKLKRLNFIIDTGASSTVINESVAGKLGLKGASRMGKAFGRKIALRDVAIPEICLHDFCFPSARARIGNLYFLHGLRVDALIGLDLLKTNKLGILSIDLASRTLSFMEKPLQGPSIGFHTNLPYVMLRLEVEGVPLRFKLDSGAGNDLILYRPRPDRPYPRELTDETKTVLHMGGKATARKVFLHRVTMADTQWSKLPALLLTEREREPGSLDGSAGLGALGLSKVQIDFKHGRISWAK